MMIMAMAFWSLIVCAQTAFEYYNIALVKYNLYNYEGAIEDLDRAIEILPSNATAYILRGAAKFNLDDFEGAIADYNRAMQIDRRYGGDAGLRVSDHRGVISEKNRSVVIQPEFAIACFNRGMAHDALKNFTEAIEDFTMALEIDPGLVKAYHQRGLSRYGSGDITGACSDWNRAADMGHEESYALIEEKCRNM